MRKQGQYIIEKRLKFKPGFQKKLITEIKEKSHLTWRELSQKIKVCEITLRNDWKNEKSTLPINKFKELLIIYPLENEETIISDWIEKILVPKWGQIKGGLKNKKEIKIPKQSEELAEFIGLALGDGHLSKKEFNLSSDIIEKEYVIFVKELIKKLFGIESKIFPNYSNPNNLFLDTYSVELIKFLMKNGLKVGNKINKKSRIPQWIFKNKDFARGAIRGLFDTDGGIYQKQKNYNRAFIEFQTHSPEINKDTIKLLKILGFKSSKSTNIKKGALNSRIQNQNEIHKFLNEIGTHNPKNQLKYQTFYNTGKILSYKEIKILLKK